MRSVPLLLSFAIAAALGAAPASVAAQPAAAATISETIPAMPLSQALARVARSADLQLVYQTRVAAGVQAPELEAGLTVEQALTRLLQGTGLTHRFLNERTVSIMAAEAPPPRTAPPPSVAAPPAPAPTNLDQVTVTASKRAQRLQDVPGGVSAATQAQLQEVGAQSNADYLGRIPGVVFNPGVSGQSTAVIRGVGTSGGLDQGQGPTGWYLNDVPLTEPGYAVGIPDIDTFDLQRVEVLRGPQGTLFGASSLGGAINYITHPADPAGFDAAFEAGVSSTRHGAGDLGYTAKAMVNLPLVADELALRAVVLTRNDPGFLHNVGVDRKGSNDIRVNGGRGSLVWTPGENTTLSLLGMRQANHTGDSAFAHSGLGRYRRESRFLTEADYDISIFSTRLDQVTPVGELTAIVSSNKKTHDLHSDASLTNAARVYLAPDAAIDSNELMKIRMDTVELRLTSPASDRFEWLVGTMHSRTDMKSNTNTYAEGAYDILSVVRPGAEYDGTDNFNRIYSDRDGKEHALFGEANLHFADHWTLTLGGRLFKSEYSIKFDRYGFSYVPSQHPDRFFIKEDGFVPKMSLRYKADSGLVAYGVVSRGFRVGNPNTIYPCECDFDTPLGWDSDSLWNYELGIRDSFLDDRLRLDAAVFYIDWEDIQVRLVRPDNATYGTNAGAARIYGLESSAAFDFSEALSLQTNLTLLDAKLSEDVLNASPVLRKGQTLPSASDVQLANTLNWRFGGRFEPTLVLQHRYLSKAPQTLYDLDAEVGGYNQFDLRLNWRSGRLGYSIYGTNLTNAYAAAFGYGASTIPGYGRQEFLVRPRTIGFTVSWSLY